MAFVVDDKGAVIGCATLEDVSDRIVGIVEDELEGNLIRLIRIKTQRRTIDRKGP